jgi:hypothetical protein
MDFDVVTIIACPGLSLYMVSPLGSGFDPSGIALYLWIVESRFVVYSRSVPRIDFLFRFLFPE